MAINPGAYERVTKVGEDIGVGEAGGLWYVLDLTGDTAAAIGGPPTTKAVAIGKALRKIEQGDYRGMGMAEPAPRPVEGATLALRALRDEIRHRLDNSAADAIHGQQGYQRTRAARRRDVLAEIHALTLKVMRDAGLD